MCHKREVQSLNGNGKTLRENFSQSCCNRKTNRPIEGKYVVCSTVEALAANIERERENEGELIS